MAFKNRSRFRQRLNLSRLAIQHARITICCWLIVAVAGFFAYSSLKYALFPDITFPVVVVSAAAPADPALKTDAPAETGVPETDVPDALATETALTMPLEESLETLAGLRRLESSTTAGRSLLNLRFGVNTSLEVTTAAVEQTIAQVPLPNNATYEVIPLNLNEATAVSYALVGEGLSLTELAGIAEDEIVPPLQAVAGVLKVNVLGAGTAATSAASPTLVRYNEQAAIALQVVKRPEANTLDVVDAVADAMTAIEQQLAAERPSAQLQLAATQSDYIRAATQATIDALLGAVVIAVLVIFAFLKSWQATLITALAIPLSLLGTCIVMASYGFNLETITLLGLAIVIGIIVDDAIVEIENIARHIELGLTPRQAAFKATEEIGLTVSASTLTIVAVFLPVAFMGGTVGQFFKPFGLTVSAAVLTSLLAARSLTPVLAAYWLSAKPRQAALEHTALEVTAQKSADPTETNPTETDLTETNLTETDLTETNPTETDLKKTIPATTTSPVSRVEKGYSRLLHWALKHRWQVVGMAIASLMAGLAIIPFIPQGFIPQLDRGEFYLNYTTDIPQLVSGLPRSSNQQSRNQVRLPPLPIDQIPANQISASQLTAPADPRTLLLQRTLETGETLEASVLQQPGVASVLTTVGEKGRPNEGQIHVTLADDRALTTAQVQAQLRQALPTLEGVITSIEDVQFIDTGGEKPLQISLIGEDLTALNEAAIRVKEETAALPGFADVRISTENNSANSITEITRKNGERVATISANLLGTKALGTATEEVIHLAQTVIPEGVRIDLDGDSARASEVLGSFGRTLLFAIICMLAVLFIPFGRFLEPAVVGLSLPLSIVGAMLALLVTRSDFGIVSLLGLLFLLGLLDKNALLLMDYANQLRRQGMPRTEAILQTGLVRLRPILMTTASTVLGMMPLALGFGAGAELRQPMAVAIIGGLMTSTLLSLVVVPVLYSLLEDGWPLGRKQPSHSPKEQPQIS
ncbi:MAG: efflux RND transporter permease subunit [Cyanobacteria bacterium P01_D01_bin.105]